MEINAIFGWCLVLFGMVAGKVFETVISAIFPNIYDKDWYRKLPIRVKEYAKQSAKQRKFSRLKRDLRSIRRRIALLKRSRLSGKRAEDFVLVIAFALAILGIVISVLSLAFINHEFTQQLFTQRQTFVFVFMGGVTVFAVIMSGPNLSTPKHYRFVLQKLESKRNNLVKKVKDAETQ